MLRISFTDKDISYATFINDLATALVPKVVDALRKPNNLISQNEAFRLYGQGNVRRWIATGRLTPVSKRPGKIEYRSLDLDILLSRPQDYFD